MVTFTKVGVKAHRNTSDDSGDFDESVYCQQNLIPFLKWLLRRHKKNGGVTEIRAITEVPSKMVWSGYFDPDHMDNLIKQILPHQDGPRKKIPYGESPVIGEANFYFNMQPANPELLARSAYEFSRGKNTTSDDDIVRYHLFAVDVDPVRPAGISATDDEKKESLAVSIKIREWFKERGVGCIRADSGNGCHLLVPTVSYRNVAEASANAHTLLQLLDQSFSNDAAKVDTTIYNPGRILKLYGTKAVKGSDVPKRPHRFATIKLKHIPDDVDLFAKVKRDLETYRAKTATISAPKSAQAPAASPTSGTDGWDYETSCKIINSVLTKAELDFKVKDKGKGRFFQFRDCPHHTDNDGQHFECCVIVRPNGSFAAKCMHDETASWKESFKAKIGWEEHICAVLESLGIARKPFPYKATAQGLVYLKPRQDDSVKVPLTNFTAKIINDIAEDDGVEARHTFEIEARLKNSTTRFSILATEFSSMDWPIQYLGAEAVIYPGPSHKEHARTAIQLLSGEIPKQTVFTHLGWREYNDRHIYLHAGGAIDRDGYVDGVRVRLGEPFTRFVLPDRNRDNLEELRQAVRRSLNFLKVAPETITMPLFASPWRAVAGGTDFSLHLNGPTGTGKSELAALVQQFWGVGLDARHLPASWSSTANANEALAFLAKDAIFVLDDFAPGGSQYDIQRKHNEADRLLRGQGNNSGRNRMRADTTLRPPKPSRCTILSTGEDVPRGQSVQARLLNLEFTTGTVNWEQLTRRQKDAANGVYATALSGFIRWFESRYDWIHGELMPELLPHYRDMASTSDQHKRTPNIIADLYLGLDLFTRFAKSRGAITEAERTFVLARGWKALGEAASMQKTLQASSEPVQRFLDLLTAALSAGKAHIASKTGSKPTRPEACGWRRQGGDWEPRGDRVGWLDGDNLYLEPEAAFAVVQRLANEGGEPLPISNKTLHKRLDDKKVLASTDKKRKRLVIRKILGGVSRSVLHLRAKVLGGG